MPFVILPSGETRYYNTAGDQIAGYSGSDAFQPGDENANRQMAKESTPMAWSGFGALPWGATPSGKIFKPDGVTPWQSRAQIAAGGMDPGTTINPHPNDSIQRDPTAIATYRKPENFGDEAGIGR